MNENSVNLYEELKLAQIEYDKKLEIYDRKYAEFVERAMFNGDESPDGTITVENLPDYEEFDYGPLAQKPQEKPMECIICNEIYDAEEIEAHVNECLDNPKFCFELLDIQKCYTHDDDYNPMNNEVFECPICFEQIPVGNGYVYKSCGHVNCCACLQSYYSSLIMDGRAANIVCPSPDCDKKADYCDIQYVLSEDMLRRYVDFLKIHLINSDLEMRWCPNPGGCGNALKRQNDDNLLIICDQCDYEFCFECSKPFHPGKTCQDADTFSIVEGAKNLRLKLWMKMNTKNCPKCKAPTQKKSGCNHMTCAFCGNEWCWLCGEEYTSFHYTESNCTLYGRTPLFHFIKSTLSVNNFVKRLLNISDEDSISPSSSYSDITSRVTTFLSNLFG